MWHRQEYRHSSVQVSMLRKLNHALMETRNLLIQISLLILGAIILFKVFQMDANQKIIKNNIEKSIKEITSAEKNLTAAQDEIAKLEEQIQVFKAQRDLLEKERETIVKNYQDAQEEDKEVLKQIKKEIEKNNDELDRLRELDGKFETGGGDVLKVLINEALDKLQRYRTE